MYFPQHFGALFAMEETHTQGTILICWGRQRRDAMADF